MIDNKNIANLKANEHEIQKTTPLSKKVQNLLVENSIDVKISDLILDRSGSILKVSKITEKGIDLDRGGYEDNDWHHYGTVEFERFKDEFFPIKMSVPDLEAMAVKALLDPSMLEMPEQDSTTTDTTALVISGGKNTLIDMRKKMEISINRINCVKSLVESKVNQMRSIVNAQKKSLKKLCNVLHAFELYLGIGEQVLHFKEGEASPSDTPISFRQQILYMDEEAGLIDEEGVDDKGIDFTNIEKFDKWVSKPEHLKRILPELKAVVVLQISRKLREYSFDSYINATMNAENDKTYILIRNGGNLYRVYADLRIYPRLFPAHNELLDLINDTSWHSNQEKAEELEFTYKKNAMLLQGIVARTQIFEPLPHPIDLFKPDTWDGLINFIHDAEYDKLITDGRPTYKCWKEQINEQIHIGSRIVYSSNEYHWHSYRLGEVGGSSYHLPFHLRQTRQPVSGVYEVAGVGIVNGQKFKFLYNPGDQIWGRYNNHERKNRVSYSFDPNQHNILNYDQMNLDDINYYLDNRLERPNYLDILPTLKAIRTELKIEQSIEAEFVKFVSYKLNVKKDRVWGAVNWWKFKNKWKRALTKDDAKALRMIARKLKNE